MPHIPQYTFWAGILAAFAARVVVVEPGRLLVRRVDVPIQGLPKGLDGLKIGQISDMHRGPTMPRSRIERAVKRMANERPDLVALTGDFVSYWSSYAAEYVKTLAPLRPRFGVFACTGNHDHWTDAEAVVTALQAAGVTVLRNRHQLIPIDGTALCVVGIDDMGALSIDLRYSESADDLTVALTGSPFSGVIRMLLTHNPHFVMTPIFAEETRRRPIQLVLAGHTHGGQICPPLIGAPHIRFSPYGNLFGGGLVKVAGTLVHVSRGAGASIPVRFNCPSEINILTLRPA